MPKKMHRDHEIESKQEGGDDEDVKSKLVTSIAGNKWSNSASQIRTLFFVKVSMRL